MIWYYGNYNNSKLIRVHYHARHLMRHLEGELGYWYEDLVHWSREFGCYFIEEEYHYRYILEAIESLTNSPPHFLDSFKDCRPAISEEEVLKIEKFLEEKQSSE